MRAKVSDLMVSQVVTAQAHQSVSHVRKMMEKNHVHSMPVVGPEDVLKGIVTSTDLSRSLNEASPISVIMNPRVYTIPEYNDVHHAARLMRNHKVHHVVVTKEKKVVGILSAFDMLKLVEEHRFVMKQAPKTKEPNRQ